MKRRVVITGLGLITPIGNSVEAAWSSLMAGRSGIDLIRRFDAEKFDARIAGEVKNFDPLDYLDRREAREAGLFTQYAIAASDEALRDSGLRISADNAGSVGTYISSGIGDFYSVELEHARFIEEGPASVSSYLFPNLLHNMAAARVSIRHGAKGPISAAATACSAGAHAVGESFKIIARGDADAMICGGAEAVITPMSIAGFSALRALSTRNDDPARASRPFDRDRDGFVMGEGAGILILEELEAARRRDACIYGEITGYGAAGEARHITMPDTTASGAARAIRMALHDGGVSAVEVGYINAHGTATLYNDRYETLAIKTVFGEHAGRVAISSTKSMTGHLLGAAGGIEAIFTLVAMNRNRLPPTINYEHRDPECDLDYVPNEAREARVRYAMSNSFGFGGTNVSLLFKRFEP